MSYLYYRAINWDENEDNIDQETWLKLTNNFWLDTRVPIFGDRNAWNQLPQIDQNTIGQQLAALSLNFAFQSELGVPSLRDGHLTQQEEAVINMITFMESVHSKAITTIFRGLGEKTAATNYFKWADDNQWLQASVTALTQAISDDDRLKRRAAFLISETILTNGRLAVINQYPSLTGIQQMVKNIMTGQAIFIAYLSYKFRKSFSQLPMPQQVELTDWIYQFEDRVISQEQQFLASSTNGEFQTVCQDEVNTINQMMGLTADNLNSPKSNFAKKLQFIRQKVATVEPVADITDSDAIEVMQNDDYDF
ncbi:ribonucleotide-diphosphate reductase subunit beta [Lactobacillus sp. 3B(2020)]|uniref:ribonucleotide-diphosphate reductase subunit beta n=1 Tax=Lactobacillus sp. 3B(2020) TaxID=2695882 RepID=UPI0015DE949C|nr:ribonucleotide-diphosphate reductase subunit beta [Lactobacillus sp. 3B(2020)]QLL70737.1 ribonucleoside-diphosphate reductase [Lactobacillus sp. 3B(2020)]